MRTAFSIGALLIVLAIVGLLAKKQLQAVGMAPATEGAAASAAYQPPSPAQVRGLPKQVQQDVEKALQQGAEARASEAQ